MTDQVDQNLYSRQLGTFGLEAQSKLIKMRVFLYGLRGVGVETAKNLILAGPKEVMIHDDEKISIADLASNFYLCEKDIGKKTRAEAVFDHLKDLNPYVSITLHKGPIQKEDFKDFDIVVFTDFYDKKELIEINNYCRKHTPKPIGFIYGGELGLYGYTFVDFGPSFTINDKTGEEPKSGIVINISKEENGIVYLHEDKRAGFETGNHVSFREVEGMTDVNGQVFEIKRMLSPYSFTIGDTSKFKDYLRQGIVEQVKVPEKVEFKPFENALFAPLFPKQSELLNPFLDKYQRPELLLLCMNAILDFYFEKKQLPKINDEQDAELLVKMVNAINED